jgi:hypothetical protein
MLPVTPCSRGNTDLSLCNAERRNRTSNDRLGRLIYSQVQCHSASSAILRSVLLFVCQKTNGASPVRTKSAETVRSLVSLIELVFEISGAGVRSRWINADFADNRRTGVLPISWYLWYSRNSAYRRLMMARSGRRAQRTHETATPQCASSILCFVP